ncbi:MAG: hypothetical protein GXY03_07420 [Solirubrobacterales bacterium]|nr:hypothetical protein [Solirubrobacterales bacterium]
MTDSAALSARSATFAAGPARREPADEPPERADRDLARLVEAPARLDVAARLAPPADRLAVLGFDADLARLEEPPEPAREPLEAPLAFDPDDFGADPLAERLAFFFRDRCCADLLSAITSPLSVGTRPRACGTRCAGA